MTLHPYLILGVAIVSEVIGTLSVKASDGFTRLPATLVVFVAYGVAFYCLSHVVKTIPLGVAYAVWSGAGVALILVAGAAFFGETPDLAALVGIALIVAGVLVIHLFSNAAA